MYRLDSEAAECPEVQQRARLRRGEGENPRGRQTGAKRGQRPALALHRRRRTGPQGEARLDGQVPLVHQGLLLRRRRALQVPQPDYEEMGPD